MPTIDATLCYLLRNGKVLLQKKAADRFGGNKYNAPGGKMQPDESPEAGIRREFLEETGLTLRSVTTHGQIYFYDRNAEEASWRVYVFTCREFTGEKRDSSEGTLEWITRQQIPFHQMWEDDQYWVPLVLRGKTIEGHFYYDEHAHKLLCHEVKVIKRK